MKNKNSPLVTVVIVIACLISLWHMSTSWLLHLSYIIIPVFAVLLGFFLLQYFRAKAKGDEDSEQKLALVLLTLMLPTVVDAIVTTFLVLKSFFRL